jgi:hypothetical protein
MPSCCSMASHRRMPLQRRHSALSDCMKDAKPAGPSAERTYDDALRPPRAPSARSCARREYLCRS